MHDIERKMGDLDAIMATRNWFRFYQGATATWRLITTIPDDDRRRCDPPYLESFMYDLKVNIFFAWRIREIGNIDFNAKWRESEMVDGVRCQTLQATLDWKLETRREKDIPDIMAILQTHPELIVRG